VIKAPGKRNCTIQGTTLETTGRHDMASRDEYVEKMKAQLDEWNKDIDALEEKLAAASASTRERLEPHLAKAREARDAVASKLSELKDAGENRWDSLQADVEHVWKTFKQSVNYFKSQL
jgi:predicted  nucleic acid-binding Zn-ribbon protein